MVLGMALVAACATGGSTTDDDSGSARTTSASSSAQTGGGGGGVQASSSSTSGAGGDPQGSGGADPTCYGANGDCDPLVSTSCPAGQGCAIATDDMWHCFPNGTAAIGQACNGTTGNPLCQNGGLCVNNGTSDQCYELCCDQGQCSASETCTPLDGPGVPISICMPM
jgi:hypothetical protein